MVSGEDLPNSSMINDKTVIINISFSNNTKYSASSGALHRKSVSNVLHNVCVELLLLQSSRAHEADDRALRMRPLYSHSDILFLINLPRKDFKKKNNYYFFKAL